MANPVVAGASMGLSGVGSIIGGLGEQKSAQASAQAYRYKGAVALFNKQINEQNARWALDAGETKAMESGLGSRQNIANTKVAQSASGLDVNTGSNEAVRDTQQEVAAFDQNVIRFDAKKTSYGYLAKAMGDEAESVLDMKAAANAEEAGKFSLLKSFISGAGNVASKWTQANTLGIFSSASGGGGHNSGDSVDL